MALTDEADSWKEWWTDQRSEADAQGQMYTTRYILFRPGWLGENQYNTSSVASYHYAALLVSSWFVGSLTLTKIQLDRNLSILTDTHASVAISRF